MKKRFILGVKSITHTGDAIGRDISFDISIDDQHYHWQHRLPKHATKQINEEIARFDTNEKSLSKNIKVAVTERDNVFSDSGAISVSQTFSSFENTKIITISVPVTERRFIFWKHTAIFVLEIQLYVFEEETYVSETDDHGWLMVKIENSPTPIAIPKFLKVSVASERNGREYFSILEGHHRGESASVTKEDDMASHFSTEIIERYPVTMSYSISEKKITINGKKYSATENINNRLQQGNFDVLIADMPHKYGEAYFSSSAFATTWFRIMDGDEKYIHAGNVSNGCLTVTEHKQWDMIYSLLIKARKGDGLHIGTLHVTD